MADVGIRNDDRAAVTRTNGVNTLGLSVTKTPDTDADQERIHNAARSRPDRLEGAGDITVAVSAGVRAHKKPLVNGHVTVLKLAQRLEAGVGKCL